jgi:LuxR family transcriptional regulator, maltose regulon positive regulatory protein
MAMDFIKSLTGSHRFILDYLLEEVLQQLPQSIQDFLLHTSILERMCGPLCYVLLMDHKVAGQDTLEYPERANLFIISLDGDRRWYRYHHLFGELLRQ